MPVKVCNKPIRGVLHPTISEQHYQLARAYPCLELSEIIEQYWLVTWDLQQQEPHLQTNLPDPCVNLFFDKSGAKLLGPITKSYTYEMRGKGQVFGVKFKPAGLSSYSSQPLSHFAENYAKPETVFSKWNQQDMDSLSSTLSLSDSINLIEPYLLAIHHSINKRQQLANAIVDFIKHATQVNRVQHIAKHFSISVRSLQRLFDRHVGLSPKWVIRKYRLHDILNNAEHKKTDWQAISLMLGYTDQPHFIKDFKDMVGMTPQAYAKKNHSLLSP